MSNPKFEKPIFFLLVGGLGCFVLSFLVMGLSPWTSLNVLTKAAHSTGNPYVDENGQINSVGRGRKIYIREGCWHCHSQFVRPVAGEPYRYGPASRAAESMYDIPQTFGTRRIGPDLSREAGRRSDDWHYAHFYNPRITTPQSVMPGYPWWFEKSGDSITPKQEAIDLVAYMQNLGSNHKEKIQEIVYPKLFKVSGFPKVGDIDLERGKVLFAENCVGCHGNDGRGDDVALKFMKPRPANLVDRYVSPSEAYSILNRGVLGSAMPSFREMPERDLWSLAEYVGSLGEGTQTVLQSKVDPQLAKKGESIFQKTCVTCHGPAGAGDGPAAIALNPRPKDFTRRLFRPSYLAEILKRGVQGSAMPPFSQFSEGDVLSLTAYLTGLYKKDL